MTHAQPDPPPQRLFFAVWPTEPVITALERGLAPIRAGSPDWLRWQAPERLHITVVFLGDCSPRRARTATTRGRQVASDTDPGELHITGAGRFGQVVWLGVAGRWLRPVHDELRRRLGVTEEGRSFRAHITVARSRGARPDPQLVTDLRDLDTPAWTPDHLDLVASTLGPDPRYSSVGHFPFRRAVSGTGSPL